MIKKTVLSCLVFTASAFVSAGEPCSIIPMPAQVAVKQGHFTISQDTVIVAPESLATEAAALRDRLAPATGLNLEIKGQAAGPQVKLVLDKSLSELGREGYRLDVVEKGIVIRAADPAGVFYGVMSLLQLLPAEVVSKQAVEAKWEVPFVSIQDKPRFAWRAFMLDEARYFKGEQEVLKLIDQMAALKMNVFHWHLTDDQGWRIEIKKYPKLTSVGSKRKDTQVGGWNSKNYSGEPHEGYYTQEQIKKIVAYAQDRHITIVPEIGMPGHAQAAIAAYPWLGTKNEEVEVSTRFGKHFHTYNPASDKVYQAMNDIFDEVIALFPSPIIHIGGDEVRYDHWKESEEVKALMKRDKLKTNADVQIYFTNRIAKIVESKKRNIMGWNEIMGVNVHGGLNAGDEAEAAKLSPDTVVHFWKGSMELAKQAVKDGHRIVNSVHSSTYLDYGYGSISMQKAYSFDPVIKGLTKEEEKNIIGTGCQMWGEWIPTVERMEQQVYPRLAAYAEVGWTPLEQKDYASFKERMKGQLKRWDLQGIHYAKDQVAKISKEDFFNHVKIDEWKPAQVTEEWKEVEFQTAGQLKNAGVYEVVFLYEKGLHALEVSEVSLCEDGKAVAVDKHNAFSGGQLKDIVYKLKLEKVKPGASYTLRAKIKGSGGTDSHGVIKIRSAE
ncbi:hypothetical protein Rhal01_03097 [Rubritalea halochordaticola]|uniref:beta-N-acetylhexosaminidase n=1 Tax=Rubritalea halochordaticola TaxID=714537 RepID=A0ABP9V5S7_9BACT